MSITLLNGAKQGKEKEKEKGGRYIPSADVVERCVKKLRRREREEKFTNEQIMLLNFLARSPIFSKRNWGAEGVYRPSTKPRNHRSGRERPPARGGKMPRRGKEETKKPERGLWFKCKIHHAGCRVISSYYGATRLMSRGNIDASFTFAMFKKQAVIRSRPIAKPP